MVFQCENQNGCHAFLSIGSLFIILWQWSWKCANLQVFLIRLLDELTLDIFILELKMEKIYIYFNNTY